MNFDRITSNPLQLNGQTCIRGMRFMAKRVLQLVAIYPDRTELKSEFPELEDEDIRQALIYAATRVEDQAANINWMHETVA